MNGERFLKALAFLSVYSPVINFHVKTDFKKVGTKSSKQFSQRYFLKELCF
jgi:hypothetical protein